MSEAIELEVVNSQGQVVSKRSVSAKLVGARKNKGLLHEVVRWQRARKRAGTHSTMSRAEMSGGGKKPWKQKGTGNARAGSNTSPLWVGGGIAHGPKPRSYDFSLNRKQKEQALLGVISARRAEGKLILVNEIEFSEIKTKNAIAFLKNLGVTSSSVIITKELSDTVKKSFRNIEKVKLLSVAGTNVYDIIASSQLIISESALGELEQRFVQA
jgi:large subunit ribosomal protein L4